MDAATLLDEVRRAFAGTPTGRELGLLDAEVAGDTLRVTFAGGSGGPADVGGSFGARVPLPRGADDPRWTTWDPATVEEWVMYAVVQAIAEEYLTGGARRGTRDPGDGVTWLVLDA
ncbi:hypothetical protein ACFWEJ_19940 [Promicromonospora sp. NPDC060204]|uniref:hypothetical protein n=1 Tax=Promicromonospora sp. NPDC060204 TaxID=3347071 RepID=UPI00364EB965